MRQKERGKAMGRARDETVIDFLEHGKEDSEWGAEYSHHPVEELNREYILWHSQCCILTDDAVL